MEYVNNNNNPLSAIIFIFKNLIRSSLAARSTSFEHSSPTSQSFKHWFKRINNWSILDNSSVQLETWKGSEPLLWNQDWPVTYHVITRRTSKKALQRQTHPSHSVSECGVIHFLRHLMFIPNIYPSLPCCWRPLWCVVASCCGSDGVSEKVISQCCCVVVAGPSAGNGHQAPYAFNHLENKMGKCCRQTVIQGFVWEL